MTAIAAIDAADLEPQGAFPFAGIFAAIGSAPILGGVAAWSGFPVWGAVLTGWLGGSGMLVLVCVAPLLLAARLSGGAEMAEPPLTRPEVRAAVPVAAVPPSVAQELDRWDTDLMQERLTAARNETLPKAG